MLKINRQNFTKGFTIAEVIVVAAIFSLLALLIGLLGRDIFWNNLVMQKTLVAESTAKMTLKKIVAELRTASQAETGAYLIEEASTSTLIFYSDIDDDGRRERIRYFLEGATLKKGITKPTGQPYVYLPATEGLAVVAEGIVNGSDPIFSYYDWTYEGLESSLPLPEPVIINNIRLVKIKLKIDADPTRPPAVLEIESQVMIRNLKDNL